MKMLIYTSPNPDQTIANKEPNIAIIITMTVLSVLGSFVIIVTFILFKDIRKPSRTIIICIAISDLISSLSNCVGLAINVDSRHTNHSNDPCVIQSLIGSTFILSSFLWNMFLAMSLFVAVVWQNADLVERLIFPWFHLIGWFVPLTINMVAVSLHKLGNSVDFGTAGWRWIYLDSHSKLLSLLGWKIRTERIAMWMN